MVQLRKMVAQGKKMTISVVMPAFNREKLILESLQTIVAQSHPVDEIIVVDDGSTDRTREVVEALSLPNLRLISTPNGGPEAARRTGIEAATGEWVALLDSDDLWAPDHIQRLWELTTDNPGCGYMFSNFKEFGTAAKLENKFAAMPRDLWPEFHERTGGAKLAFDRSIFVSVLHANPVFTSCSMFKKSLFNTVGGINPKFARTPSADADFVRRCAVQTNFAADTKVTVDIRKDGANFSSDTTCNELGRLEILSFSKDHEPLFGPYRKEISEAIRSTANAAIMGGFSYRKFGAVAEVGRYVGLKDLSISAALRLILSRVIQRVSV